MADISVIKLPNASSYNVKDSQALASAQFSGHELTFNKRGSGTQVVDLGEFDTLDVADANVSDLIVTGSAKFMNGAEGLTYSDLKPIEQKVYESTSQYATAANNAKAAFFFMSVKPYEWNKPWTVRFKVRSYCPSYSNYDSVTYATWSGSENNIAYANWNQRAYYHGHYYLAYYPLTQAGFNAGYGHAIAINLLYASSYTSSAYYRTFEVEYYECENCIVTILDSPVLWENWIGGNTTNYGSLVNTNAVDRGLQETGDANTTSISTLYNQYGHWIAGVAIKRYEMLFTVDDRHLVALNELDNQYTNTAKELSTTTKFDPLGKIYYYNSASLYNADATIDSGRLYYSVLMDMRYTFNISSNNATNTYTCVAATPCYLKVSIGADGMATIADAYQPLTSTLPSSPDGYYYIYLGRGYDWYRIMLATEHPVYCYTNNGLERYLGNKVVQGTLRVIGDIYGNIVGTVNGHNVLTNVPTILDDMVANFSFDNDYAEYKSWQMETEVQGDSEVTSEYSLSADCKTIVLLLDYEMNNTDTGDSTSSLYKTTITPSSIALRRDSSSIVNHITLNEYQLSIMSDVSSGTEQHRQTTVSSFSVNVQDNVSHIGSFIDSDSIKSLDIMNQNSYSSLTPTTIYENGSSLQSKYLGIGAAVSGYHCISVNGSTDVWLRIPQRGLIPYNADATNGDGYLGTSTYPFKTMYCKTIQGQDATFSGTVTITKTTDASGTANNSPALIIGGTASQAHIEIDGNEIMAKGSATTTGVLTLNNEGGAVNVGSGGIDTTGNMTVSKSTLVDAGFFCENSSVKGTFYVSSGGNLGIYNRTKDRWCLRDSGTYVDSIAVFRCYNEGYTTLRPTIGTNTGTNAMSVIVSNASSVGFYGRWAGGASASFSGRTISCPSSDIRLKENISPTREKALDVINKIPMYQFDWKNKDLGHQKLGFVVDHMEKIDPKFSIGGEDDTEENPSYKSVNTFYLQGYEVKAIQELSEENKNLKKTIQSLEERLTQLEKRL